MEPESSTTKTKSIVVHAPETAASPPP